MNFKMLIFLECFTTNKLKQLGHSEQYLTGESCTNKAKAEYCH